MMFTLYTTLLELVMDDNVTCDATKIRKMLRPNNTMKQA